MQLLWKRSVDGSFDAKIYSPTTDFFSLPLSGFNGKSHLKRHVERMHEIADRAVCDICGKWFSSACTLNIHLHRHKSQENKKTCPYCGKQVADLTQHVNVVHLGTRRGGIIKIPGQVIYPNRGEASQQVEILNVTEEQAAAAPPPGFQWFNRLEIF